MEYVNVGKELYQLRVIIEHFRVGDVVGYGRLEKIFDRNTII
jgi:hypothetical protein